MVRVYTGCTDVRDDFSALLDGELAAEEREALEAHLSDCSDCLRALDGLKRVDTLFRKLPHVNAPKGFDAGLRDARKPRLLPFPTGGRSGRIVSMLAAAAVLMIVAGVSFMVVRGGSPETEIGPVAAMKPETSAVGEAKEASAESFVKGVRAEDSIAATEEIALAPPPPMAAGPAEPEPEADSAVTSGGAVANAEPDAEARFEAVADETMLQRLESETVAAEGAAQKATALSDAPAPQPADRDDARARTVFRTAPAAPAAEAPLVERMAEPRDGTWYEPGYLDQSVTEIERDGEPFAKMLAADVTLRKYVPLSDAVVFQFENQWYRLKPVR